MVVVKREQIWLTEIPLWNLYIEYVRALKS